MKALIVHHTNGTTRTVTLTAPLVGMQMIDGGVYVSLMDEQGGSATGTAMFTSGGVVALLGSAVEQYTPLAKPEVTE